MNNLVTLFRDTMHQNPGQATKTGYWASLVREADLAAEWAFRRDEINSEFDCYLNLLYAVFTSDMKLSSVTMMAIATLTLQNKTLHVKFLKPRQRKRIHDFTK